MTRTQRRGGRRTARWLAGAVLLSFAAVSSAQNPCPVPVVEAWVDPYYGNDNTALVGRPDLPFGTIQRGIFALSGVANAEEPGLLHLMPGIYSTDRSMSPMVPGYQQNQSKNREVFPIQMATYVSVQGTGAKECVVQVRAGEGTRQVPWPDASGGATGQLPRVQSTVAFDFSFIDDLMNEMLDGITIQGAEVQVLAWAEERITARISNCVFDMRAQSGLNIPGSIFGILVCPIWDADPEDYPEAHISVFNNTFIQAWKTGPEANGFMAAPPDAVAICDVNDPDPTGNGTPPWADPDLRWRGVSDLHVQNNLVRTLEGDLDPLGPRTAFLGLDFGDTAVILMNGTIWPTNSFAAAFVGGFNATGTLRSRIVGAPPVPIVDSLVQDPGFFGEMNTARHGVFTYDARLLPSSPLVDMGQAPEATSDPCLRLLTAVNGRVHGQRPNPTLETRNPLDSFDLDGEGHGNPRVVGSNVNVGYDETDALLIGGCYGENSKSHNVSWDLIVPPFLKLPFPVPTGNPNRIMISPTATAFAYHMNSTPMPNNGGLLLPTWNVMPGSLAIPLVLAPGPIYSWVSLGAGYLNLGAFTPIGVTWTNWVDGSTHTFGEHIWTIDEVPLALPGQYLSSQTFSTVGGSIVSSNLQAEYF